MELEFESRTCRKCGYASQPGDSGPDYACPKCGAVYAKLEALHQARLREKERQANEEQEAARLDFAESRERERAKNDARGDQRVLAAHAVYLLICLPFCMTQALALVIAYRMHRPLNDWVNEHFAWQIRTAWYVGGLALLAGFAYLMGGVAMAGLVLTHHLKALSFAYFFAVAAMAIVAIAAVVALYRICKGWVCLFKEEAP
jgi:uncharacterized membrane protein